MSSFAGQYIVQSRPRGYRQTGATAIDASGARTLDTKGIVPLKHVWNAIKSPGKRLVNGVIRGFKIPVLMQPPLAGTVASPYECRARQTSVSYTHLDVYKRQIVLLDGCLPCFFDAFRLYVLIGVDANIYKTCRSRKNTLQKRNRCTPALRVFRS